MGPREVPLGPGKGWEDVGLLGQRGAEGREWVSLVFSKSSLVLGAGRAGGRQML